jgi:2-furoyl-CoA dehydrogenase FAD binding subunit
MKPGSFDYVRAGCLAEALEILRAEGSSARVLAGGQSLLPMLSMRLARPAVVVDISRTQDLTTISTQNGQLVISASVSQARLLTEPGLAQSHPLLAAAMPWIGHAQTRARGTVCGSIAHADPSAELALCLIALHGTVRVASARGRRVVPGGEFITGMMTTDLRDDELIEAVSFPAAKPGTGYAFNEFGRRRGDFAIVSVAAVATASTIEVTIGGVDDTPAHRSWSRLDGATLDDALNALAWEINARDDVHASARLRRDLVRALGRRVIEEAIECIV